MKQTIHLQGIGKVTAKPVFDIKVGDVLSWNYAPDCSEVVAIEECGSKSVNLTERYFKDGKEYTRRFTKTRLVACVSNP